MVVKWVSHSPHTSWNMGLNLDLVLFQLVERMIIIFKQLFTIQYDLLVVGGRLDQCSINRCHGTIAFSD